MKVGPNDSMNVVSKTIGGGPDVTMRILRVETNVIEFGLTIGQRSVFLCTMDPDTAMELGEFLAGLAAVAGEE